MSRSLGRGLAALIPDSALDVDMEEPGGTARMVPIDEIAPNPEQPRTVFEPTALEELSASIDKHGVLIPLVVRQEEGKYFLIAGERRLRAAALAGLQEVPVVVRDVSTGIEQLELALVENLQREDLDPIEAAKGFQRLIDEYGYTQAEVADRVGKNRATVANSLRLLNHPDFVLDALRGGFITAGHARALLPLVGRDDLTGALKAVIDRGLSVRATESMVAAMVKGPTKSKKQKKKDPGQMSYATNLLSYALRTTVEIQPRKRGGGRIVIDYANKDDLERLIDQLRGEGA